MGLFDKLFSGGRDRGTQASEHTNGFVPYGKNKQDGGHDHRGNRGSDRTPAQKEGDKARTKKD